MNNRDKVALNLCINLLLDGTDKRRRAQIAEMIRERGFVKAGIFAAAHLQSRNLRLRPWEVTPAQVVDPNGDDPAARLLSMMLARGLSRFDPDPTKVLGRRQAG